MARGCVLAPPNPSRRTVIRVAGLKDEDSGDEGNNTSIKPDLGMNHDRGNTNTDLAPEGTDTVPIPNEGWRGSKEEGSVAAINQGNQFMESFCPQDTGEERPNSLEICSPHLLDTNSIKESQVQDFQEQLVEIDGELVRYDNNKEGRVEGLPSMNSDQQSSLVGSKVVGSTQFLKNLFCKMGLVRILQ